MRLFNRPKPVSDINRLSGQLAEAQEMLRARDDDVARLQRGIAALTETNLFLAVRLNLAENEIALFGRTARGRYAGKAA